SYLIMFIYTIAVVDNIRKVRLVLYPIIASSALIVIIGGLQFFGVDIFKINFFRSLLNLNPTASQPYGVQTIHKIYTSYSTLYNPNMLSHYLAMVLPLGFAFFAARKGNAGRIGAALLIYLLMLSLFGASSSGGYYALAASVVLLLFLAFPYIRKNIMNLVMLTVIVVGLLMVTNLFTGGRIASRIGVLSVSNEISMLEREGEKIFINDISLADDEVFIDTTDKDFYVRNSEEIISVRDRDGNTIPVVLFEGGVREGFKGDVIAFESPEYRQYVITTNEDYSIFAVKAGIRVMYFHMTDNGVMVPGLGNKLDVIRPVERVQFLYERPYLFSKRGSIWSGVLPLLKDTVVIGRGPDTTFLTYPQYDYIGKINMAGYFHIVIEKPHCYYLQLAHDTGWISLAILLALFAFYFFSTIRLLVKSKKGGLWRAFTIASLCSVCGYLIAGVMYDSSVQTAPVFWTILAIGFALNQIGKRELSQAKTESRDSGEPQS
ncbi:MAG: O-antigen ligase family protein, partial [Clostridia bacterium]|nr:O-antigen ligase family protein [Clostridia bacterium]